MKAEISYFNVLPYAEVFSLGKRSTSHFRLHTSDLLNSARLSPVPLVFKTVRNSFPLHGSSMIWCLSRIPHYPFILNFFKFSGGLRLGAIATGFFARTAIVGGFCIVAVSV